MIHLNTPYLEGNEWKYVKDCLDTNWVSSAGGYIDRFEEAVADFTGAKYAVSSMNGTTALHIGLITLGVQSGDIVIVPNLTFIASVNAIKYIGADPLFMDVDEQTWQIDVGLLEKFLREETAIIEGSCTYKKTGQKVSAIMPVHVLGNMVDIQRLCALAKTNHIKVIEDATEALGSYSNGQHSGTFGDLGCFSFNGNKIITTGGGGMLVTNDEHMAKRAKHLTTQAKEDTLYYVHDEVGYNYRMVNILAAVGLAQMEQLPEILKIKEKTAGIYYKELDVPGVTFQSIQKNVMPNHWMTTVRVENQQSVIKGMIASGIQVRPLWYPMNKQKMFKEHVYYSERDVTADVVGSSISLPSSAGITREEILQVCKKLKDLI